jgi:hypothetical protein
MSSGELLTLEREGWDALRRGGDAARDFYDRVLAREVLMLLPGGMVIDDREQVVDAMRGPPWDDHELFDERVLPLGDDAAVVAYRARARRGEMTYEALFNSTYVREDGAWRLALHEQTPL